MNDSIQKTRAYDPARIAMTPRPAMPFERINSFCESFTKSWNNGSQPIGEDLQQFAEDDIVCRNRLCYRSVWED